MPYPIIGEIEKFKVHEDGTVNIIIKGDTSTAVPNGLKELGSSTYNITVSQKMWKKVSDKLQGNRILFTGEPKAAVTVKGVPFTLVNCFDISVIEQKVKENQAEPKKAEPSKPVQPLQKEVQVKPLKIELVQEMKSLDTKTDSPETTTITKKMKENLPSRNSLDGIVREWRKNNEITQIPFKNIVLEEKAHLNHANFKLGRLDTAHVKPMTVKQIADNKYALVMGLKSFVTAKLLDMETVPVILCDINFNELTEKLGIAEMNGKEKVAIRQIMD
ncbi:MAG: hypothetical protein JJE07_14460 [Flavobacteriaceae bacterium]|nr:hypothetical protein [Flavobacteriaceae bacterium]